jgi:O-antigen/teichoic acid export membrane protein
MQNQVAKTPSEKKRAFLDFAKILFANICHLASGIVVELLIPKLLGYDDYGFYKTFSLYIGYLGLLHFGITDGIYFTFAGKELTDEVAKKLHSALLFLFIMEAAFSLIGITVSLCFVNVTTYGLIFLLVSIYNLVYNMENCYGFVCQALKRFSVVSIAGVGKSLINIAYVGICYWVFTSQQTEPSFVVFSILTIAISFFADILYSIRLRRILFTKGQTFKETWADVKGYLVVGVPLLFANLTSNLLMNVDKQFISIFYPVETSNIFSIYSFAYSMLGLITVATSAISLVLFPYMRGKDQQHLIDAYPRLMTLLNGFTCFCCFSYFFVVWFINAFMTKYVESLPIFRVLLPGLVINTSIVVLMHSYYKTFNKVNTFFIQNLIVLALAIAADAGIYYLYILPYSQDNPIGISITSVGVILVWYVISESYLVSKYHVRHWKNDAFLIVTVTGFYLFTQYFSLLVSFLCYLGFYPLVVGLFFPKEIKSGYELIRSKMAKKKPESTDAK